MSGLIDPYFSDARSLIEFWLRVFFGSTVLLLMVYWSVNEYRGKSSF
jgi:hypothetical protein